MNGGLRIQRVTAATRLYRVMRPGWADGGRRVHDEDVLDWIRAVEVRLRADGSVPRDGVVRYVCLLGWTARRRSEVASVYHARRPGEVVGAATREIPLFEDMLNVLADGRLVFEVSHVPTTAGRPLPAGVARKAAEHVRTLLARGATVLLGCSDGGPRTSAVVRALGRLP